MDSTLQNLASALTGGIAGYIDSQQGQPITATVPLPQTAYGYAGVAQPTPTATASVSGISPTVLMIGAVAVVALLMLRR